MKKFSRKSSSSVPPTAIFTADWHIRPTVPVCRTDDFLVAMWKKVEFILNLSDKHQIPILIAGDVGLKSQWPNWLLEEFIGKVKAKKDKAKVYAIPGQHDLPDHNLDLWRASAIGVLHESEAVIFLGVDNQKFIHLDESGLWSVFPFPYGIEVSTINNPLGENYVSPLIAIAHTLVTEGEPKGLDKWMEGRSSPALSLLKKFPEYSLILTGDNHKPFVQEYEGRLLVNPGSLMRTTADQANHKPRVYLWYAQDNRVEPVYLPIEEDVIDRTHIDLQEAKDERIEAYVSRLSEEVEIGLSFEGNLESYFKSNRIRKPVQDKVWGAMPK